MAIGPADLLAPTGPVEKALFRGEDVAVTGSTSTILEVRLQKYIERAYSKIAGLPFTAPDNAARAWALYLTFEAAYLLSTARPASEDSQLQVVGSQTYAKDQRDALKELADRYFEEYTALAAALPTVTSPRSHQSRSVTNVFDW